MNRMLGGILFLLLGLSPAAWAFGGRKTYVVPAPAYGGCYGMQSYSYVVPQPSYVPQATYVIAVVFGVFLAVFLAWSIRQVFGRRVAPEAAP